MKEQIELNETQQKWMEAMPIDVKIDALYGVVQKLLDEGAIKARVVKYKLNKYINSKDAYEKLYAINKNIKLFFV